MKDRKPWSFCETPDEKCTMNYCDENGCQNRNRQYTDLAPPTLTPKDKAEPPYRILNDSELN